MPSNRCKVFQSKLFPLPCKHKTQRNKLPTIQTQPKHRSRIKPPIWTKQVTSNPNSPRCIKHKLRITRNWLSSYWHILHKRENSKFKGEDTGSSDCPGDNKSWDFGDE